MRPVFCTILCVSLCCATSITQHSSLEPLSVETPTKQCVDASPDCSDWQHTYGCDECCYNDKSISTICPFTCGICDLPSDMVERVALEALYNATGGAEWDANSGWMQADAPHCEWDRVLCINVNNTLRVSALYLSSNNLNGSISPAVGQLSQLTSL